MNLKHVCYALLGAPLAVWGAGAENSAPAPTAPFGFLSAAPARPAGTIVRVYWQGKKRLAADTNAAGLMSVWNLPESARLERQTLDKLSFAPWQLLRGATPPSANQLSTDQLSNINYQLSTNQTRPLLDDLVQNECFLEVRQATNQLGELAFAIRLNNERAGLWETNLAAALESLTGIRPAVPPAASRAGTSQRDVPTGWALKKHHVPNLIQLARAGEWTVLGAAQDHNALFDEMLVRIQRDGAPFSAPATNDRLRMDPATGQLRRVSGAPAPNFWLEADVDLRQAASALALNWDVPAGVPPVSLAITGTGTNVLTVGNMYLPESLPGNLESWIIPAGLIRQPLAGFTAIRGVKPWVASLKLWNDLQIGSPPDQICFWALRGAPPQTFFAAPLADASNRVCQITDLVLQKCNPKFAAPGLFEFEKAQDYNGLAWKGVPFMTPYLKSVVTSEGSFVSGGFLSPGGMKKALPPGLLQAIGASTNLVGYDWELTGERVEAWIQIGQFCRFALRKAQLAPESAGMAWLKAIEPKLGVCVTEATRTGPARISFTRKSGVGFTGLELHLIADWLESPEFPRGLHTFLASPPPLHKPGQGKAPPPPTPGQH
jgi:hypothetical protein